MRERIGFGNVIVMVPFCRTPQEADKVLAVMAEHGLVRGEHGLQVYMMCEIPSNVILAEEFATRFDGFSIGSNDLTQLVLGVDRDSAQLAALFDERDEAVMAMIARRSARRTPPGSRSASAARRPSNHPEFAAFLVERGHRFDLAEPGQLPQDRSADRGSREAGVRGLGRPAVLPLGSPELSARSALRMVARSTSSWDRAPAMAGT